MATHFRWWSIIKGAGGIIALASLLGILINVTFLIDVLKGEKTFNPEKRINDVIDRSGATSISLPQAKQAFDDNSALFVDSRSEEDYAAGHIPGAVNVPWEEFGANEAEYLIHIPSDVPIITYCGGSCESSAELAEALIGLDYREVHIFVNGWPSWVEASFPIE
jgi:rhodanese-related sulfurtransferase